jgi:hypothetical protein
MDSQNHETQKCNFVILRAGNLSMRTEVFESRTEVLKMKLTSNSQRMS